MRIVELILDELKLPQLIFVELKLLELMFPGKLTIEPVFPILTCEALVFPIFKVVVVNDVSNPVVNKVVVLVNPFTSNSNKAFGSVLLIPTQPETMISNSE